MQAQKRNFLDWLFFQDPIQAANEASSATEVIAQDETEFIQHGKKMSDDSTEAISSHTEVIDSNRTENM